MKILIADSSDQIIRRLEEMITAAKKPAAVYKSSSYGEAQLLFQQWKPQVIVLGITMPEHDCLKLLIEIKKASRTSTVIILSININPFFQEQCLLQGADFFLDKYYEYEKITAIINTLTIPET